MSDHPGLVRRLWDGLSWAWDHSLGWWLTWALVLPIRAYQRFISPLTPPSCRLHPSCSAYGLEAMKVHGALKGTALTAARLGRCNPWNDGGIDPVPALGRWKPDVDRLGEPRSETMSARPGADSNA